jgi:hypothetical protein
MSTKESRHSLYDIEYGLGKATDQMYRKRCALNLMVKIQKMFGRTNPFISRLNSNFYLFYLFHFDTKKKVK